MGGAGPRRQLCFSLQGRPQEGTGQGACPAANGNLETRPLASQPSPRPLLPPSPPCALGRPRPAARALRRSQSALSELKRAVSTEAAPRLVAPRPGRSPGPSRRGGGLRGGALRVEVSRPRASLAQTSYKFLACSARPDVPSELQVTELYWTRRSSSPQVVRPRVARCPGPAGPGAWGPCAALERGDHTARSPSLASSTQHCVSSTQCALAAVSRSLRG